jgi:choline dehydrogenase-like flavoprotein
MSDLVIGSGPSGVAAAMALLDRGRHVVMIDGGGAFEPSDPQLKRRLAETSPDQWSLSDRAKWSAPQFATPPGQTRRFGSDAAMESPDNTFAERNGVALRSSRVQGGLSNLWGSAVLPYRQSDLGGWPITDADLAPHYRAVASFLPIAGTDAFDALFPAFPMAGCAAIAPSSQAARILGRLARTGKAQRADGAWIGPARQAVANHCQQCGLCLHGCPFDLIWSARHTLGILRQRPGFSYRPGPAVTTVTEETDHVSVMLADGSQLTASRVFLGAGVLETARILLASGIAPSLTLLDSQQALLPFLHNWSPAQRPDQTPFTTLPQIFVEIDRPDVSPNLVHAQLYSWNDHFPRDLVANYARLPGMAPILRALARRLIVAQIFLHSDHSSTIGLRLASDGRLIAQPTAKYSDSTMDSAVRAVSRALGPAGLHALRFATRMGAPGSSFHTGGSVPMARERKSGQSDVLGRPFGQNRLHLIDASVFPSVPATTITLNVMANAHRIASVAP